MGAADRATSRRTLVLAALAGAGLVALSSGRVWLTTDHDPASSVVTATVSSSVRGGAAVPGLLALAVVAAAGAAAVSISGRRLAQVCAAALTLAGLALVALVGRVIAAPVPAARSVVADSTGLAGEALSAAEVGAWAVTGLAGSILVVVAGGLMVVRAPTWRSEPGRFERAGDHSNGSVPNRRESPEPLWDAITRGEDPTD